VIYNPVPQFALARRASVDYSTEPRLLHVSKWETRKNIPRLIAAFRLVADSYPELVLRLVGTPVSEASRAAVMEAIESEGVAARVHIFDHLSDDELASLYATSQGLVMPSLYEGFSIPVVEAFAFGLPVAASSRAAVPEIAADAAIYFDPEDERDMARAIEAILFDEPTRRRLKERSARRLEELSALSFRRSILDAFINALPAQEVM
jgi:glycosyltransferase involved in cell wall biosynthesis